MTLTVEDFRWLNTLNDRDLKQYIQDDSYREKMTAYFGEEEYESLRELLDNQPDFAELETEIILLPGIMGSELADEDNNKVWVNVKGLVVQGNFLRLQHSDDETSANNLKPVGLYQKAYFKTKQWLQNKGYTVHSFAYDWRKPIDESAAQLKEFVEKLAGDKRNKQFVFVAHSMGGLVTRRYLEIFGAEAEDRLEKLIMLGTPNKGSYLPFMAMKGNAPVVKISGFLYGAEVVRKIVQSFPGLYELCPDPEIFGQENIYSAGYWGEEFINTHYLDAARNFHQKAKASLPDKMFLIANRSLKTVTRVEREENGNRVKYRFLGAKVGDGTVPFDSAYIEGVTTYETGAGHGEIQKDNDVLSAIHELINKGKTDYLDRYRPVFAGDSTFSSDLEEIDPSEIVLEL